MHIKEIIIDGFKSYSVKTSISGFDRHFNAITGLNGSGKSNILDAICFVLGITSLSNVRASNLQELIYKYGNAGINKASVTIIFDNMDKKYSPIGCEDYEEIIVTRTIYQGKSKYYLNGYTATQDNIKSLFQSVQLNINNPHFLIMQGKVTQVVNMKPLEVLGLLEEAAGTSIYEMKKESALKTIKKKENKLEEINKILSEEISPQLEKLMKDKQNYLTWKSRESEIARIMKILTAYDYYYMDRSLSSKADEIVQFRKQEEECRSELLSTVQEVDQINNQILQIESKFRNLMDKSLKDLENRFKESNNQLKSEKHNKENILKNLENNHKEINKFEALIERLSSAIENLEKHKKDKNSNLEMFEKDLENKQNFLRELERNLENVNAGKNTTESELHNLNKLITEAKNNINKARAEKNNLSNQINFLKEESKKKEYGLSEFKKSLNDTKKQAKDLNKQVTELTDELNSLEGENNNPQMQEMIQKSIIQKEQELSRFEAKQNEILSRWASRVETSFRDPEANFDRSKVKGRVIRLFNIENERYATALEQVAGGKMFNIIVDTETTAQLLLSRKCFDYGVILIPINKISSKPIPEHTMRKIQEIAGNEARLAIDLIKFDREYTQAMQFVFGNTFVCTTSEVARKLAYNDQIRVKCVNLDGDIFDPSGMMTGGANIKQDSILLKVQELNILQERIKFIKSSILETKREQQKLSENANRYNQIKMKLDQLNIQQRNNSEENINKTLKGYENEINKIGEEVIRAEERINQLNGLEKKYSDEAKKLEAEYSDFKNSGQKSKDVYVKKIKGMKETIQDIDKNVGKLKKEINDIEFKINQNVQEIDRNKEK
jgi:structural maintenance of chromosome 2